MLEVINVSQGFIDYNYKINLLKMMECCNGPDSGNADSLVTVPMDSDSVATEPYEQEAIEVEPAGKQLADEETVFNMETDEEELADEKTVVWNPREELEDAELASLLPLTRSPLRRSRRTEWTRHDENKSGRDLKAHKTARGMILLDANDIEEDRDPISIVSRRTTPGSNLFYASPSCKSYTVSLFASQKLVSSVFEKVRCIEVKINNVASDEKEDKPEYKKARLG
jgi:hypothetical protein